MVPEAHPWPRSSRTTALGALAQRFDGLRQHILAIEAGRLEDYVSVANPEAFWKMGARGMDDLHGLMDFRITWGDGEWMILDF